MLPIVFRSVDRIVNDPCRSCKFPHVYNKTNFVDKKNVKLKNEDLLIKTY